MTIPEVRVRENSKGNDLWMGDDLHPTHRRVRDGWGTRALWLAEEGNSRSPSGMTTREAKARPSQKGKDKGQRGGLFRLFCFGFNFRTAVDEGVVCSRFNRAAYSVIGFYPYDVEGDFIGHSSVYSSACSDGQGVV